MYARNPTKRARFGTKLGVMADEHILQGSGKKRSVSGVGIIPGAGRVGTASEACLLVTRPNGFTCPGASHRSSRSLPDKARPRRVAIVVRAGQGPDHGCLGMAHASNVVRPGQGTVVPGLAWHGQDVHRCSGRTRHRSCLAWDGTAQGVHRC
jgi:hypothetical protein